MDFPVKGGEWYPLEAGYLVALQSHYPALDVAAECLKARDWLDANPRRRKTWRGMRRFLVGWLNHAKPAARSPGSCPARPLESWEDECLRVHDFACAGPAMHRERMGISDPSVDLFGRKDL
jgi:hypothetical protein